MAKSCRGFFSLIQFCPDLDRAEAANVGVILVVPEVKYFNVRFSEDNEGPKQRFTREAFDDARLALAKVALEARIRNEGSSWRDPEDLRAFSMKEGNNLVVSPPRTILSLDPQVDLDQLYDRLVHVNPKHQRKARKPDLRRVFEPHLIGVPLQRDLRVPIPELGHLRVPYAYRNGRLNLIRPEAFPAEKHAAASKVNDLAVKGHLIYKKPHDGEDMQLIVIGGFDPSLSDAIGTMAYILNEHDTRLVPEDQLPAFIEEVRREAHG